jgi:hypothetical protein
VERLGFKRLQGSNPPLSAIFNSSSPVFEEGLNLSVRPAKVEYQTVFLSLKY